MKNTTLRGLFAAALVLVSGSAFAQQGSNDAISAKATVVQPVAVEGTKDLIFGNVTPGNVKTISSIGVPSLATGGEQAGEFAITKGSNTEVIVAFTLPTVLSFGQLTLPIAFETTDARFSNSESAAANGLDHLVFNPNTNQTLGNTGSSAPFFGTNAFWVYLGGKVTPAVSQAAGDYAADVTLTVTYN
jgi:hypothetical protein